MRDAPSRKDKPLSSSFLFLFVSRSVAEAGQKERLEKEIDERSRFGM